MWLAYHYRWIAASVPQDLGLKTAASIKLAGPEGGRRKVPVVSIPEVMVYRAGISRCRGGSGLGRAAE